MSTHQNLENYTFWDNLNDVVIFQGRKMTGKIVYLIALPLILLASNVKNAEWPWQLVFTIVLGVFIFGRVLIDVWVLTKLMETFRYNGYNYRENTGFTKEFIIGLFMHIPSLIGIFILFQEGIFWLGFVIWIGGEILSKIIEDRQMPPLDNESCERIMNFELKSDSHEK